MKVFFRFCCALALSLVVTASAQAQRPIIIKLATEAPEGSHWHLALREIEQSWESISEGRIEVRIFAGGIAGSDSDVIRKMRIGQLQAATLANIGMSEIAAETLALSIPMMFRTNEEYLYVRGEVQPEIESAIEDRGYKILTWSDIGWAYLFSKQPVFHPDDLKQLKLGTPGYQTTLIDAWRSAGYRPVVMSLGELLTALQSGLAEAVVTVPAAALAFNWYNAAPHMTDLRWSPVPGALVITAKAWNQIPADLRPQLLEAARLVGAQSEMDLPQLEADAIAAMVERGLAIHAVGDANLGAWEESAALAHPVIVGSSVPEDMFDKVKRLVEEYRASAGAE